MPEEGQRRMSPLASAKRQPQAGRVGTDPLVVLSKALLGAHRPRKRGKAPCHKGDVACREALLRCGPRILPEASQMRPGPCCQTPCTRPLLGRAPLADTLSARMQSTVKLSYILVAQTTACSYQGLPPLLRDGPQQMLCLAEGSGALCSLRVRVTQGPLELVCREWLPLPLLLLPQDQPLPYWPPQAGRCSPSGVQRRAKSRQVQSKSRWVQTGAGCRPHPWRSTP